MKIDHQTCGLSFEAGAILGANSRPSTKGRRNNGIDESVYVTRRQRPEAEGVVSCSATISSGPDQEVGVTRAFKTSDVRGTRGVSRRGKRSRAGCKRRDAPFVPGAPEAQRLQGTGALGGDVLPKASRGDNCNLGRLPW